MQSNSFRKRRHGKIEELDVLDLDPYHSVPQDAIIGSPTTKGVVFVFISPFKQCHGYTSLK